PPCTPRCRRTRTAAGVVLAGRAALPSSGKSYAGSGQQLTRWRVGARLRRRAGSAEIVDMLAAGPTWCPTRFPLSRLVLAPAASARLPSIDHAYPRLAQPRTSPRKTAGAWRRRAVGRRAAGDLHGFGPARPGRGDHRPTAAGRPRPAAPAAGAAGARARATAGPGAGARLPALGGAGAVQPLARRRPGTRRGAHRPGLRRPLLRPAPARPGDRDLRGAVPGYAPP